MGLFLLRAHPCPNKKGQDSNFIFTLVSSWALALMVTGCSQPTPLSLSIADAGLADDVAGVVATTGDGAVHLNWQLPADAKGVSIRRDSEGPPFSVTSGSEVFSGPETEFIDEGVQLGRDYYYLIVTIDRNLNFAGGVNRSARVFSYGRMNNSASDSFLEHNGDFYFGGKSSYSAPFRLEKRDAIGELDPSFGEEGVVEWENPFSDGSYESNTIHALAISGDAILTAADISTSPGSDDLDWQITKRDLATGSLVTDFGDSGILTVSRGTTTADLRDIYADETFFLLGGRNSSGHWQLEKRRVDTGNLVTGFATGGVRTVAVTASIQHVLVKDNAIFVGGSEYSGTNSWRLEKLRYDTGALMTAFDGDGILQESISVENDEILSLAADDNHIYLAGYSHRISDDSATGRLEKRNITTGALVGGFADSGVLELKYSNGFDQIVAITLDDEAVYIAMVVDTHQNVTSDSSLRIEKRAKATGELVTDFGDGGTIHSTAAFPFARLIISGQRLYFGSYRKMETVDLTAGQFATGELIEYPAPDPEIEDED